MINFSQILIFINICSAEETCERLDINSAIYQSKLPDGEYKISIVIEKI